jgi:cell wall-associated NlpC family hydrolase
MYMGNGKMIHTYSQASGGVRIDKLEGAWKNRFLFGGSVLK